MDNPLFAHRSSLDRRTPHLPHAGRIAVWVGVSIEHFELGRPALSLVPHTAELVPDPLNYGWRDYGPRAGFERILRVIDRHEVRVTGILNADAADRYPEIVEAGRERGWTWVAHGRNNSRWHAVGMTPQQEAREIADITATLTRATGGRPRGWLGPALTSTMNTNDVLAAQGYDYVLDWPNDDLPYDLSVSRGRLLSVPHSPEINDIAAFVIHHHTGPDFARTAIDQFDALYAEGAHAPRVFTMTLHPYLIGQPSRIRYLDEVLAHIGAHPDVWHATTDDIADWYARETPNPGAPTARRASSPAEQV